MKTVSFDFRINTHFFLTSLSKAINAWNDTPLAIFDGYYNVMDTLKTV